MTTVVWVVAILLGLLLACGITCAVVVRNVLGRPYPTFLAAKHWPRRDVVPVILYHAVTQRYFARELRYLRANGYESIRAETLVARLNGEDVPLPERPIVLTFDDGHESLWSVAYPLLQEFGYRAVAFVCPAWEDQAEHLRSLNGGRGIRECCPVTWDQLREMDASGIVDVQSHTFDHSRIWVDSEVIDFMKPNDWLPFVRWDDASAPGGFPLPPLGWPILPHCQRFNHRRRFFPDRAAMQACADYVAAHGGPKFFRRDHWADALRGLLGRSGSTCRMPGRWETANEQRHALRRDLEQSKRAIEQRLNKRVEHLVFPKNEASLLATSLAAEVGYRSTFRGPVVRRDLCQLGDDPMCIPRAFCGGEPLCYVLSLPGQGRRGPERLFAIKLVAALRARLRSATAHSR